MYSRLEDSCFLVLMCIQVMFFTSTHMEYIHDHADYGFTVSDPKFNWR